VGTGRQYWLTGVELRFVTALLYLFALPVATDR
jgi:hypothetical protein